MRIFNLNQKDHWERVYKKHASTEVGWYQAYPARSLKLISDAGVGMDSRIIDIGGGTSKLAGYLLDLGDKQITVLDLLKNAIEKTKMQLGEKSGRINWIEANVTKYSFTEQYDIWHDRAVFHFLTKAADRKGYKNSLDQALKVNEHLIISTFSPDAPPKCSGLPVVRYSPEALKNELGSL